MNKFRYMFAAALAGFAMTACDDDDTYGPMDDLPMVTRSVSLADGASVRAESLAGITVDYNNLVGLDKDKTITINGVPVVNAVVNPSNGMQLIIALDLQPYQDYTLVIPEGAVYRSDDKTVIADGLTLNFDTKTGINKNLLSPTLINPNASSEAKAVYAMLVDNYSHSQLSGAMGEVAWGTGFCDLIKAESGKFPAIVGFDYIHLASSPANWIDYGDITPVKTVWDAGSIPAVTWHWNVPKTKPGTFSVWTGEVAMPGDWTGFLQLTDDNARQLLSNVVADAVLTVKTKDVNAGAQGSVKNSGWIGLTPELEYFDISGDYSVTLTADMANEIRNNGFIISGHDYTVTEVTITIPAGGDMGYDASSDVFKAANVLVDGSWENQVALADVEKLAGYMTLLRDANIPVLFRPFHEAAGDYTWGSWFWWGNSGVDTTKQLWSWLYDKLTNQYGLNNLIWVWTVQTSDEGKLADISKLQAAYPGDELVDIVGVDLYVDPLTTQTAQFDLLYNLVGGKKLVALSECGNLLDVDSAFDDGALWSFFMGWYEQNDNGPAFIQWNTNGEWATVLNNPRVLNQGEFQLR